MKCMVVSELQGLTCVKFCLRLSNNIFVQALNMDYQSNEAFFQLVLVITLFIYKFNSLLVYAQEPA